MDRNQEIQKYLSVTPETNYSLWKATKRLKRPQTHHPIKKQHGNWARSKKEKTETFAEHFSKVFKPNPRLHKRKRIGYSLATSFLSHGISLQVPLLSK